MRIKYNIPLQNNKGIPLFVNCSVFTFLRLQFKKLKLHIPCPFTGSSLVLEKNNNILPIESCLTYDYKNDRYTSKCAQIYVSPNFTPYVNVYVTWRGNVSSYPAYIEALHRDWDIAVKQLEERGEAYVNIPNTSDHKYILQRIECMEHAAIISDKTMESNNFTTYDIKYADEYRPELYY